MLLDVARDVDVADAFDSDPTPTRIMPVRSVDWSIIVPFFNERDFLGGTLASLAAQTRSFTLVLVDNGSTDGSARVAVETCEALGLDWVLLNERRPGKVFALTTGLERVRSPLVATCDADTWYPP